MVEEKSVNVGCYAISDEPVILGCIGLGSCLAIAIYDKKKCIGGMAHAMLPRYLEGRDRKNGSKYVDTAIYLMVDEIVSMGGSKKNLVAKLVGGAQMFSFLSSEVLDIGKRNIEAAKQILEEEGIKIISEDLGGKEGRTIAFHPTTGVMTVRMSKNGVREI